MTVRQRHPGGVATRLHTLSPAVDYAGVSDKYYGQQIDVEPVAVTDLGAGSVTEGAFPPGGLDGGVIIRSGTLPPATMDTTPPPLPTAITVTSLLVPDAAGRDEVAIVVNFTPPGGGFPIDYFATYIYTTSDNNGDPVAPSPVWTRPIVTVVGKDFYTGYVLGVAGATQYWVKLQSVDGVGNLSGYSATYPVLTVGDVTPPDIPQAVAGAGGFKLVGLSWQPNDAPDLMHNEVRIAPSVNADGSGGPDTTAWDLDRVRSSVFISPGLNPGFYYGQVRAVDFSGNVVARWSVTGLASTDVFTCLYHGFVNGQQVQFEDYTGPPIITALQQAYVVNATATTFQVSLTVGGAVLPFGTDMAGFVRLLPAQAVDYLEDPEAGWSPLVGPLQATLIGAADMAVNSLIANMLSSGIIDAGTIQTGVLNINTGAGPDADGIKVWYGGNVVGQWDENGLDIRAKDPARTGYDWIHIDDAALTVYQGGAPMSAITPQGINATAINFGVSPGGHNLVFNSSFELSKFIITLNAIVGVGGSTLAGGVGGWVLVSNTNGSLAAGAVTMLAL